MRRAVSQSRAVIGHLHALLLHALAWLVELRLLAEVHARNVSDQALRRISAATLGVERRHRHASVRPVLDGVP